MRSIDHDADSDNLIYTARYRESEVRDFAGNPLIEALPRIKERIDWIKQLSHKPTFDPAERQEPAHLRSYYVLRLQRFFQPLPRHQELGSRIDQILRHGYVGRSPVTADRGKLLQKLYEEVQQGEVNNAVFCDTQPIASFSLMGASGVGKTTTTERILSAFPQVIYHPKYALTQVVWLKLDCPHDGDIKNLGLDLLVELDRALNTDFRKQYGSRIDQEVLLGHVKHLMATYSVGLIVIDEIQNLNVKRQEGRDIMMNYFQTLCNTFKVPIMLMGTIKAMELLQKDLRQARRATPGGAFRWERLKNDEAWRFMLEGIWEFQWTKNPIELTQSMIDTLYQETQGIVAVLSNAFILAQLRALRRKKEELSEDLFKQVIRQDMAPIQPMLNALRSGDKRLIQDYDDLEFPFDDVVEKVQQSFFIENVRSQCRKTTSAVTSDEAKAIGALEMAGFSREDVEVAVTRAAESGKKGVALTRSAYEELCGVGGDIIEAQPAEDPDDLRKCEGADAVQALRQKGIIKGIPGADE